MSALKPCPFCGAGSTEIRPQTMWNGMRNAVISVSIVHHCERIEGQPSRSIERIGSDEVAAVEAWNLRACPQAGISLADTSHRIL